MQVCDETIKHVTAPCYDSAFLIQQDHDGSSNHDKSNVKYRCNRWKYQACEDILKWAKTAQLYGDILMSFTAMLPH